MYRVLDLGATSYRDGMYTIELDLDSFFGGMEEKPVVGDYNHMPYADESFQEAIGCCYLEEPVDWKELHRVLVPGARAYLSCCTCAYAPIADVVADAKRNGFVLETRGEWDWHNEGPNPYTNDECDAMTPEQCNEMEVYPAHGWTFMKLDEGRIPWTSITITVL